jgi:hypothetical protein
LPRSVSAGCLVWEPQAGCMNSQARQGRTTPPCVISVGDAAWRLACRKRILDRTPVLVPVHTNARACQHNWLAPFTPKRSDTTGSGPAQLSCWGLNGVGRELPAPITQPCSSAAPLLLGGQHAVAGAAELAGAVCYKPKQRISRVS